MARHGSACNHNCPLCALSTPAATLCASNPLAALLLSLLHDRRQCECAWTQQLQFYPWSTGGRSSNPSAGSRQAQPTAAAAAGGRPAGVHLPDIQQAVNGMIHTMHTRSDSISIPVGASLKICAKHKTPSCSRDSQFIQLKHTRQRGLYLVPASLPLSHCFKGCKLCVHVCSCSTLS